MGHHPWSCLQFFLLTFLLSLSSFNMHPSTALSYISSNQPLSGSQTLVSKEGNFVLGLFSPGKSRNYYIGIWYKVSNQTSVWVANREAPILDPSSFVVKIDDHGNLVITIVMNDNSVIPIWSTDSTSITSNSTVAELLDSGNLVLRDGSNSSMVFWQSFDHPTDTWLPGGRIGRNEVTGVNQLLTSWKNSEDPAPGIYSFEPDPNGTSQFYIQWNRSKNYWSSGHWNGQFFSGVPEMTGPGGSYLSNIYTFEYITNARENYFTYSVKNNSIITRFVMDLSGQIKQLLWMEQSQKWFLFWSQPKAQCQVYSFCGSSTSCGNSLPRCSCLRGFRESSAKNWSLGDFSAGCVRITALQCDTSSKSSKRNQDRFYVMSGVKLPDKPQTLAVANADQCESACLKDCACTAYSYATECSLWYEQLLNLQNVSGGTSNGTSFHLRLAASELPKPKSKEKIDPVVVVGALAGCLILCAIIWLLVWRHQKKVFRKLKVLDGTLVAFKYSDLRRVTKNFSEKLGGGGFGSVFKGKLPDSTEIAVKKLEGISQGEKQFRTEVSTIGTIQHVNLVRLRGFCSEGAKRLLVYDYMPSGSLDAVLFHSNSLKVDWNMRHKIMLDVARGLAYLHEKCRDCIIHCDIKPENILLDACLVAKVADFGLAKLVGRDFSRVVTTMRGTRGYLAPEWISGVAITAKADVYSYGMMLFEIVSGRRNSEQVSERNSGFFPAWAASKMVEGDLQCLLDPRLEGDTNLEQLDRVCRTACWCIQDDGMSRPSMGEVVQILEGVVEVNLPPIPVSLRNLMENPEQIIFFSDVSSR